MSFIENSKGSQICYLNCDSTHTIQDVSYIYINTSFKYHSVHTKVHDLLGQPSYIGLYNRDLKLFDTNITYRLAFLM